VIKKRSTTWALCATMLAAMFATLAFAASAWAHEGEYAKFDFCPSTNPEVFKCLSSVTESGEVVLGSKTVPIVNPVTLQGGTSAPVEKVSKFFGATNGVTLSKAPQPVPGGLAGLVNCKEITNFILKAACEWTFENGLTGVNSTLELAQEASAIQVSESHLTRKEGVALRMPVKAHLENPLLGSECYVGSSGTPIIWELTSGKTSPPPPNESITGSAGKITFLDEGGILNLSGNVLVDNAWSAPGATGCGGIFAFLLDPIVNTSSGLPSAAGNNTAILKNTINVALAETVNER
jgi:hypothetical protein